MNARAQFTADASDHPSVRRAALALHGAAAGDRDWLLQQLPAEQRATMEAMLKELSNLGLPRDRSVVRDVLRTTDGPGASRAAASRKAVFGTSPVGDEGAWSRAPLLEQESDALVAHLLASRPLAERARWLELLSPAKQQRLREMLRSRPDDSSKPAAPKLAQALASELAALPQPLTTEAAAPQWTKLLRWFATARSGRQV